MSSSPRDPAVGTLTTQNTASHPRREGKIRVWGDTHSLWELYHIASAHVSLLMCELHITQEPQSQTDVLLQNRHHWKSHRLRPTKSKARQVLSADKQIPELSMGPDRTPHQVTGRTWPGKDNQIKIRLLHNKLLLMIFTIKFPISLLNLFFNMSSTYLIIYFPITLACFLLPQQQ